MKVTCGVCRKDLRRIGMTAWDYYTREEVLVCVCGHSELVVKMERVKKKAPYANRNGGL